MFWNETIKFKKIHFKVPSEQFFTHGYVTHLCGIVAKCSCYGALFCVHNKIRACTVVICSRNRVPGPGSTIPYPVPNSGNYYPVFHRDRTKSHQFWPVFASVHDVKQYCISNVLSTSHSQTSSFSFFINYLDVEV